MSTLPPPPSFWATVRLMLSFARIRSKGRGKRQQQLMRQRKGKTDIGEVTDWGGLGFVLAILLAFFVNGIFAAMFKSFNTAAQQVQAEASGKIYLRSWNYSSFEDLAKLIASTKQMEADQQARKDELRTIDGRGKNSPQTSNAIGRSAALERKISDNRQKIQALRDRVFSSAASLRTRDIGGDHKHNEEILRQHFDKFGLSGFLQEDDSVFGLDGKITITPLAGFVGLGVFVWWFLMLAFQGEGLELDFQRRRHPMWEWMMSHPVKPGAVFFGEMLSPLAANPFFIGSPAFWIGIHWMMYGDFIVAVVTGLIAGLPVAIAACCASKALEIATMLRLSPRTRGAVLGIMSWLGYSAFILAILSLNAHPLIVKATGWIEPLSRLGSWPMFGWLLGYGMGAPSVWKGIVVCWGLSAVLIFVAVKFSAWATNMGLAGGFGSVVSAPVALSASASKHWLRDPLHRKELLWFWRDRGALVQVFLIPMTIAAQQALNLRGLADVAARSCHTVAGAAVIFGTYFLFILGPRSLISEGPALWIPLTWPRGMEALLKAKARLWWFISCIVVYVVLAVDVFMFPADAWRIALIAVGWFLFSGSLAEKSVTLVTAPSSSGEPEPVPQARRWAASLGTFTFATGVITQRWSLAFVGIVYSWLTSAAMWQNFRARLPFLFDPWSEKVPPPPTLMHAMISISAMIEGMAVIFGLLFAFMGANQISAALSLAYGIAGLTTWICVHTWMGSNGVRAAEIWQWPSVESNSTPRSLLAKLFIGAAMGAALGLVGLGYLWVVHHIPWLNDLLHSDKSPAFKTPDRDLWLFIMAVGFAPVAEEYLFRGLLYRALDREWGGWRAVVASSLFFAIYHPPMSWIPVALVGLANACLFRRSGHLMPCVLAHIAYNAVVIGLG